MKKFISVTLLAFSSFVSANNVIVNGTRFIYPGGDKEISIQLNNTNTRPALVQMWLDNGNKDENPETIKTPFLISSPITKIEGKSGQTIRIREVDTGTTSNDKETLWWLNMLEIPPTYSESKDKNKLQLAIRSRFKFIYRPAGLKGRDSAPEQLKITAKGNGVEIVNPTPFYITVSSIIKDKKVLNKSTIMLSPNSKENVSLKSPVNTNDKIIIGNINDYGTNVNVPLTVR